MVGVCGQLDTEGRNIERKVEFYLLHEAGLSETYKMYIHY